MRQIFGISTYLQDISKDYIKSAAKNGAKYVFTSLQITEENLSDANVTLKKLINLCHENNLSLVPDISPITFEKLGITSGDFEAIKKMGIDTLRLDYGFNDVSTIKELQNDFLIMLNASTIDETFILKAKEEGINLSKLIGIHNYYPKSETGLSLKHLKEINHTFNSYGIPVVAFVPGHKLKRFPLYEGLPTVEHHRGMHPYVSAIELLKQANCDGIMVGDSMAYDSTILFISEFLENKTITIPVMLYDNCQYLFKEKLTVRKDTSELIVRITTPRKAGIKPQNNGFRHRGDICMQNELANRYGGELQICKQDLGVSPTANKIGFVHPDFLDILKFTTGEYNLKFIPLDTIY